MAGKFRSTPASTQHGKVPCCTAAQRADSGNSPAQVPSSACTVTCATTGAPASEPSKS